MRAYELTGVGQRDVAFVEHRGETLEHVRDTRCDFELTVTSRTVFGRRRAAD